MLLDNTQTIQDVDQLVRATFPNFTFSYEEGECSDGVCHQWFDDTNELGIQMFPRMFGEWYFILVYNWSDEDNVIPIQADELDELKRKFYMALEGYASVMMTRVGEVRIMEE